MRRNAAWPALLIAAGVAGYIVGAGGREGPGAPRRSAAPQEAPAPEVRGAEAAVPPRRDPADAATHDANEREPAQSAPLVVPIPVEPIPEAGVAPPGELDSPATGAGDVSAGMVHPGSAAEALLRDDLARGGPMGFLRGISRQREKGPWLIPQLDGAFAVVHDAETFAKIFAPRATGPTIHGPTADWSALADGTTLEYPAGVFEIRWRAAPARFPRDLVLKGAGMDRTLLRVMLPQPPRNAEIHGLTLVDVTVDGRGGPLLLDRDGMAALRLVRCRVARVDDVLRAKAGALHAESCEFELARFQARLLEVKWGVARLDGCAIRGIIDVHDGGDVACLFHRCTFVDASPYLQPNLEKRAGVHLEECRFEVVATLPPPRALSTINPAWAD